MTQKKINGYVIYLKEILGKGSYGSVSYHLVRSTKVSRMEPKCPAQSRSSKKN